MKERKGNEASGIWESRGWKREKERSDKQDRVRGTKRTENLGGDKEKRG